MPGRRNGRHLHHNFASTKRLGFETYDIFEIYASESPGPRAQPRCLSDPEQPNSQSTPRRRATAHAAALPPASDRALVMFSVARSSSDGREGGLPRLLSRPGPTRDELGCPVR
jgi:hypothetical protein